MLGRGAMDSFTGIWWITLSLASASCAFVKNCITENICFAVWKVLNMIKLDVLQKRKIQAQRVQAGVRLRLS